MDMNRRETLGGMAAGALAASTLAAAPAEAQMARRLGSKEKVAYWVATVTPCDAKGMFDPGAMKAVMEWHQKCGADGVVVLGTSGEFPSFSVAERKFITETAMKHKGNMNIIVGPGTSNIVETIDLARHAQSVGADGLLVIPPFYFNQPPNEGLIHYYTQLFEAVTIPINLYHIPGTSEVGITHEVLKAMMKYPHLAGIKDSSGDPAGFAAFLKGFPELNMRCGTSNNLIPAVEAGMGAILADGNQFSDKCADIFKTYRAKGDWKAKLEHLRAAQGIIRDHNMGANTYASMKYVLSLRMGGPMMYARTPYPQLSDAQKASLKAGVEKVMQMA
ncbi:dihydrodipicolinate synthase family protein [Sandarakinorhabdus rubra]|uniref:dihydrodipicolinate synthase family protein n=1 Tax=Sandarakinorhabdus rubra TaxID=2672568 RepID=UPI0013DA2AC8|nr:dihydrodipicolinate synthase family protein [Sandarakinorhabdus rubra]